MSDTSLFVLIAGFIIYTVILYLIIQSATKAEAQVKNQLAIISLLIRLCRAQGVSQEEIDAIKKMYNFR